MKIVFKEKIKKLLLKTKPRIHLHNKTIFVSKDFWNDFAIEKFQQCKNVKGYNLVVGSIEQVNKKDREKIVAYIGSIDKSILKDLINLEWLQIASHGYNGYNDASLYTRESIIVTNLKDVFSDPIAQYCVAAYHFYNCFALRRLCQTKLKLEEYPFVEKPKVIILGAGNIGNSIAKRCKAQGWEVCGVKRDIPNILPSGYDAIYTFDKCLKELKSVDYVINILPDSDETKEIFNAKFFEKMKPSALFCNLGRGTSVNEHDLVKAIENKVIRGAILDASTSKRFDSERIIVTGHMSSVSSSNRKAYDEYFSKQLTRYIAGEKPENLIDII